MSKVIGRQMNNELLPEHTEIEPGKRCKVPYFPAQIQPLEGEGFLVKHPVLDKRYSVNSYARELLELCNGISTWEEIILKLNRKYRMGMNTLQEVCWSAIAPLEKDGLLWWRNDRMQLQSVSPPAFVLWNLTDKCNHRCQHCVVDAACSNPLELSTTEALRFVDDIAEFGVGMLVLSGGEPLLRPDFLQIVHYAHHRGLRIQVATNATLMNGKVAKELAAIEATTQVSLDGATPETHDRFRQCSGAWDRTVKGIKELVKAGVPVMIASVVTKHNADEIKKIYQMSQNLGASTYRIMPFVPFGRGILAKDLELSPLRMKLITKWLHEQQSLGGLAVAPMEFECLFSPPPASGVGSGTTRIGCDGAVAYCTLTSTGDILPCNFFHGVNTSNIRNHPFEWIWNNDSFLSYFRSLTVRDIQGVCQKCEWMSVCRGSCIAANFVHGNVFQSNCHCWYARELEHTSLT